MVVRILVNGTQAPARCPVCERRLEFANENHTVVSCPLHPYTKGSPWAVV